MLRDKAHRWAISHNTSSSWKEYRRLRNRATSMLRAGKANYLHDLAMEDNITRQAKSQFWNHLSHLKNKPTNKTVNLPVNVHDCNEYFLSIPSTIISDLPTHDIQPTEYINYLSEIPSFTLESVDEEVIDSIISKLDTHKATGADQIPSMFIVSLLTEVSTYLLFQLLGKWRM